MPKQSQRRITVALVFELLCVRPLEGPDNLQLRYHCRARSGIITHTHEEVTDVLIRIILPGDFLIRVRLAGDAPERTYRIISSSVSDWATPIRIVDAIREGKEKGHGGHLTLDFDHAQDTVTATICIVALHGEDLAEPFSMRVTGRACGHYY
jgi:hypothetical protein